MPFALNFFSRSHQKINPDSTEEMSHRLQKSTILQSLSTFQPAEKKEFLQTLSGWVYNLRKNTHDTQSATILLQHLTGQKARQPIPAWATKINVSPEFQASLAKVMNLKHASRPDENVKSADKLESLLCEVLDNEKEANYDLFKEIFLQHENSQTPSLFNTSNVQISARLKNSIETFKSALLAPIAEGGTYIKGYVPSLSPFYSPYSSAGSEVLETEKLRYELYCDIFRKQKSSHTPQNERQLKSALLKSLTEPYPSRLYKKEILADIVSDALNPTRVGKTASEEIAQAISRNFQLHPDASRDLFEIVVRQCYRAQPSDTPEHVQNKKLLQQQVVHSLTAGSPPMSFSMDVVKLAFYTPGTEGIDHSAIGALQKAILKRFQVSSPRKGQPDLENTDNGSLPLFAAFQEFCAIDIPSSTSHLSEEEKATLASFKKELIRLKTKSLMSDHLENRNWNVRTFISNFLNRYSDQTRKTLGSMPFTLLGENAVHDPEHRQVLAQMIFTGKIPLELARDTVDKKGVAFLGRLLNDAQLPILKFLNENNEFFSVEETKELIEDYEPIIPTELSKADEHVVNELNSKIIKTLLPQLLHSLKTFDLAAPDLPFIQTVCKQSEKISDVSADVARQLREEIIDEAPARIRVEEDLKKIHPRRHFGQPEVPPEEFPEWKEATKNTTALLKKNFPTLNETEAQMLTKELHHIGLEYGLDADINKKLTEARAAALADRFPVLRENNEEWNSAAEKGRRASIFRLMSQHEYRSGSNIIGTSAEKAEDKKFDAEMVEALTPNLIKHIAKPTAGLMRKDALKTVLTKGIKEVINKNFESLQISDAFLTELLKCLPVPDPVTRQKAARNTISQHYPDLSPDQKTQLADALCAINVEADESLRKHILRHLHEELSPEDVGATANEFFGIVDHYRGWTKHVNNIADALDHDSLKQVTEARTKFAATPLYSTLIENTFPYLSIKDVREILSDQLCPCPEEIREKLEIVNEYHEYMKTLGMADDDENAPLLMMFAGGDQKNPTLLQFFDLHSLNFLNLKTDDPLDGFKLVKRDINGGWKTENITLPALNELVLPRSIDSLLKSKLFTGPVFGAALENTVKAMATEEKMSLTKNDHEILLKTCHQIAEKPGCQITVDVEDKKALMERMSDKAFLDAYTELGSRISDNRTKPLIGQATNVRALSNTLSPTEQLVNLPNLLLKEMANDNRFKPLSSAIEKQMPMLKENLKACMKRDEAEPTKSELYYLLGLIYSEIGSVNALGYHVKDEAGKEDNVAFHRFRLMGAYCLAKCAQQGGQESSAKFNELEKKGFGDVVEKLALTYMCSAEINRYMRNGLDAIRPFVERTEGRLLRGSSEDSQPN